MGKVYCTKSSIEDVGRKPVMNYVLAVITTFSSGTKEITLKARGRSHLHSYRCRGDK